MYVNFKTNTNKLVPKCFKIPNSPGQSILGDSGQLLMAATWEEKNLISRQCKPIS